MCRSASATSSADMRPVATRTPALVVLLALALAACETAPPRLEDKPAPAVQKPAPKPTAKKKSTKKKSSGGGGIKKSGGGTKPKTVDPFG